MARSRHARAALVALITVLASRADAQATHTARLNLVLRPDGAGVSDSVLAGTARRVVQLFEGAQIDVRPSVWDASDGESVTLLVLVTNKGVNRLQDSAIFGLAAEGAGGRGQVAYAFYERARQYAYKYALPITLVLACIVAHEIGHLLLPAPAHGRRGIMKASWTPADLSDARAGRFGFLPEQAMAMRRYLSGRTLDSEQLTASADAARALAR